jgi:hypothetical protein
MGIKRVEQLCWVVGTALLGPLDGVGGRVFTDYIEHTFEHSVKHMVREVLL